MKLQGESITSSLMARAPGTLRPKLPRRRGPLSMPPQVSRCWLLHCMEPPNLLEEQNSGRWPWPLNGALTSSVSSHIWCDNESVVKKVRGLLNYTAKPFHPGQTNHDMWHLVSQMAEQLVAHQVTISWVPSHMEEVNCKCPDSEWLARWNSQADMLAGAANHNRGSKSSRFFVRLTSPTATAGRPFFAGSGDSTWELPSSVQRRPTAPK